MILLEHDGCGNCFSNMATRKGGVVLHGKSSFECHMPRTVVFSGERSTRSLQILLATKRTKVISVASKNIRPGGYSDHNLHSSVYLFRMAGPCELQLHVFKEFDQIPFSTCLKTWVLGHFDWICACCAHHLFLQM